MDISVSEFKQRCLALIRRVERTGIPVTIRRRGRVIAQLRRPVAAHSAADLEPWERLRATGGRLLAEPGESVATDADFDALR